MKRILLSACMIVAQVYNVSAQSARTTVEIDGQVQPAVSINVNEQQDFVKESLNNLLKNAGAKTDSVNSGHVDPLFRDVHPSAKQTISVRAI